LAALRAGPRALAHAGLAAVVFVGWPAATDAARGGALEIHAIDVGQGDALAIRTPGGRWILVDAGARSPTWDAGEARVVPFLLEEGAGALALLVLTHPDADHVGGAAAVLDALPVAAVLEPGIAVGKAPYLDALRVADRRGTRWYRAAAGVTVRIDDIEIHALAPGDVDAAADANEFSVVFRIVYGDFAAFFTGDASAEVEEKLVADSAAMRSQVLKVGHHGSATSTSQVLLDAVRPVVALISVGRSNRYGHPNRRVLRRLEDAGIRVFRTDEDGAVRVRAWRDGHVDVTTSR
ncbi:MAG: ComEC/Rec2 family competence protein, partial [Longimicrobiales bacterium]